MINTGCRFSPSPLACGDTTRFKLLLPSTKQMLRWLAAPFHRLNLAMTGCTKRRAVGFDACEIRPGPQRLDVMDMFGYDRRTVFAVMAERIAAEQVTRLEPTAKALPPGGVPEANRVTQHRPGARGRPRAVGTKALRVGWRCCGHGYTEA